MKKVNLSLVATCLCGLLMVGCGSSDKDNSSNEQDSGVDNSSHHTSNKLDGAWNGYSDGEIFATINMNLQDAYIVINANDVRIGIYGYLSDDGTKTIQPNDTIVNKTTSTNSKIEMAPLTQSSASNMNANAACGLTTWAAYLTKNVTGTSCDTVTGTTTKNIYLINGSVVEWGDSKNPSADGYPDSLDQKINWIKQ